MLGPPLGASPNPDLRRRFMLAFTFTTRTRELLDGNRIYVKYRS